MKKMVLANFEGRLGIEITATLLQEGATRLDALEAGIRAVESNPEARSVGFGGRPNLLGEMECDGAMMDGANLLTGSVGAVKHCLHVVSLARKVMEKLPHVFLVGDGAEKFAQACDLLAEPVLEDRVSADYDAWACQMLDPDKPLDEIAWETAQRHTPKDTTAFLVSDGQDLAGATSTTGWPYKYPGRLGDSPIIGAGLYADSPFGACACTHTGEMTIRAGTAVSVIRYMQKGATVREACFEAMADLGRLKDGFLGEVIIHAVDTNGCPHVLSTPGAPDAEWWFWEEGMASPQVRESERLSV